MVIIKLSPPELSNPDAINSHFIDSVPVVDNVSFHELIQEYRDSRRTREEFSFAPVSEDTVFQLILSQKSKSVGLDGLSSEILRLCCPFLLPYITHIINFCISHSVFPSAWKIAKIIPLPKVNKPEQFSELRPISILPTICKITEKILEIQLRQFLHINNILPPYQSGFRAGYSCTTTLLDVVDEVCRAVDQGKLLLLVLLDFSRAFDTINHDILDAILFNIGLSEHACKLFSEILRGRCQRVLVDGVLSSTRLISSGVPQGSVLGPLLYSIYTFNLQSALKYTSVHFYADDTQLMLSFNQNNTDQALRYVNEDVNNLVAYAERHSLCINATKSSVVLFGGRVARQRIIPAINVRIRGETISLQDKVKDLGVMLDYGLRFKSHISRCIKRAYANLRIIFNNRGSLSKKMRVLLCDTLVLSQFNYADAIYNFCIDRADFARIQKVQNACLRLIFGIRRNQHISHKIAEVGWLDMATRRTLHAACLFHKIISTKVPHYLFNKISYRTDIHNLNVRFKGLLTPPRHSTAFFERSFSYNIVKMFNALPCNILSKSVTSFKHNYKCLLVGDGVFVG